jgi:lysyl-tRNA synthetase, class II
MSERLEDIILNRTKKLDEIKQAGIDPYPSYSSRTHTNQQALDEYDNLNNEVITLVGRVRSWRDMGKIIFCHIEDGTAKIQVLFKSDDIGVEKFKFALKHFDIGDFIEVSGKLFKTKTEEKTLAVGVGLENTETAVYKLLAKSLRPLPSEHFGLSDEETRLRKRYLDILLDPKAKEIFVKKNKFWSSMRSFLVQKGFLELEMPVLEAVPGGAEAEPFITHHNALDRDFYLRISLELPLKKMLVAGYEKVFEIGRIFRNEGISTEHLQDYTQMEFYWAYGDFEKLMDIIQEMYQYIIMQTFGTLEIPYQNNIISWGGKWPRLDYFQLFKKHTGIDLNQTTVEELKKYADEKKVKYEPFAGKGRIIDLIFKKTIRILPQVASQPVFLINQPVELEPLAKRDPKNPLAVQRMQILACGSELGKGFGELNDPIDQKFRFNEQMKLREQGDAEAQMLDEDYVEAMEYGMPPAAGFGISERLFSVLMDKSIRETTIFPLMKEGTKVETTTKNKETKIAVAILNGSANLEPWQVANSIAHLSAELGVRQGSKLLFKDEIQSKDGVAIKLNIQHAILIKTASDGSTLKSLCQKAKEQKLEVAEFTREMLETTDDKKIIEITKNKNWEDVEYLGVLVFGKKSEVDALCKELPLFK